MKYHRTTEAGVAKGAGRTALQLQRRRQARPLLAVQPESGPLSWPWGQRDRLMAERVAFLGTGIIGAPMARNLLKAGFQVCVWNRTPEKARVLAAEGADLAETPADAVLEAAFVITMLIDGAAVLAVMGQAADAVPDGAV